MKRLLPLLFLLLLLSGCAADQVENQAFALSLGLDQAPDGQGLRLTAQVPAYGSSGGEQEQASSGYLVFSAEGGTLPEAFTALRQSIPRRLRLCQLLTLVISRQVAQREDFPALVRALMLTPDLYATAAPVLCEGEAGEFIRAQSPRIGTRLSTALRSELSHGRLLGTVPPCTLADLFFASESVYGDAVAARASQQGAPVPGENRYEGAALLRLGRFAGFLSGRETQLLSLLRGELSPLTEPWEGQALTLRRVGRPAVHMDLGARPATIEISLSLTFASPDRPPDGEALAESLRRELLALIGRCQALACEPLGLAERAAAAFSGLDAWRAFDWRSCFSEADVRLTVSLTPEPT